MSFFCVARGHAARAEGIRLQPNLPIDSAAASPRHATLILLCAFSVLPLCLFLPSLPAIALAAAACVRVFDAHDAAQ